MFDLFFKIKALHAAGVSIHLHCFRKDREPRKELEAYCASVHYYDRNTGHKGITFHLPYMVSSRANEALMQNLEKDAHPILLEGIHSTYFLHQGRLKGRKVIVRLHNVEYQYYRQLARETRSWLKKLIFYRESVLLEIYERKIAQADCLILAVTEQDAATYRKQFGCNRVAYLAPFIPWDYPICKEGIGNFCLYHGNLGVAENENAAIWLLEEVFDKLKIPFVIAGKSPSSLLQRLAHQKKHTCIVANPSEKEMEDLIQKAQINIIPSFTTTGIKYKLLNAVFSGRHCLVNAAMTAGTPLASACYEAKNAEAFQSMIMQLFRQHFDDYEIQIRQQLLHEHFNNRENTQRLIKWIF